jgi:hypothetical protein
MHVRGLVGKSPHLVIESMGLSTINFGKCESQHAWEKRKLNRERGQFLQLGRKRGIEFWVLGREDSHSGY